MCLQNLYLQGYWQPEGDINKYTVAIKVLIKASPSSQKELLQVIVK